MTHSDKSSSAANVLGQESMAHSVTGCMWQQADFPADAFLSRGTGTTRNKPVCITNAIAAHEG